MPRARHLLPLVVVALTVTVAAMLLLDVPASFPALAAVAPGAPAATRASGPALRDEPISLYAAGELTPACERFSRVAADEAGRVDAASCFETWAWRALRDGRPDEARALFVEGLRERPRMPGLRRGLGVAAIHAGRLGEAIAPLEAAVAAVSDPDPRLLLARLYDQRDDFDGRCACPSPRRPRARRWSA